MAKKGIEYVVFGKLQENGTYKDGKRLSPAANFNGSPTKSNVKDYGDNRAVETDSSVTGGTLTVELNDDTDEIYTIHTCLETNRKQLVKKLSVMQMILPLM